MYAVVKTGGKQYRVTQDDVIIVEKLDAGPGSDVELDQVLALGIWAARLVCSARPGPARPGSAWRVAKTLAYG